MSRGRLLFTIVSLLIGTLSVPLILRLVKPNPLYGFRTPLTLSDPEIWYPANAFAGRAMLIASLVSVAGFWLAPDPLLARTGAALTILLLPLATSIIVSLVNLDRFHT